MWLLGMKYNNKKNTKCSSQSHNVVMSTLYYTTMILLVLQPFCHYWNDKNKLCRVICVFFIYKINSINLSFSYQAPNNILEPTALQPQLHQLFSDHKMPDVQYVLKHLTCGIQKQTCAFQPLYHFFSSKQRLIAAGITRPSAKLHQLTLNWPSTEEM